MDAVHAASPALRRKTPVMVVREYAARQGYTVR